MKIKVLYLIYSSQKNSGGGHFHSLKAIAEGLKNDIEFRILNLGAVFAKPLINHRKAYYINLFKYNFILKFFEVLQFVRKYNPDVLHAFDLNSLFIARTIRLLLPIKVVFTKCGGSNGKSFIPYADAHILFSNENLNHFQKYGNKNIPKYLLPNRANRLNIDKQHELNFKEKYSLNNKFIIMRISRFNPRYDLTFQQSVSLLKKVQTLENNVLLVFIGQIQSEKYFNLLKQNTEELPVLFVTEDIFTNDASRLLNIADIVIATGRGVMEASSLNKTIFCPVCNSKLPTLLNDESFYSLFAMNFSERARLSSNMFYDNKPLGGFHEKTNTEKYFEKYFSVFDVKAKYLYIYRDKYRIAFSFKNYVEHALRFFKP